MNFKEIMQKGKGILQKYAILFGFLVIVIVLGFVTETFFTLNNLFLILKQVSCIGITTVAMCMLIIMGCIDLSVGSVMAVSGVFGALMVSEANPQWMAFASSFGIDPVWIALLAGILMGTAFGVFNGLIIAKGKIPPFIVTLGSMTIARGLAYILSQGMPVAKLLDSFTGIGAGKLTLSESAGLHISNTVFFYIGVVLLVSFILKKRRFGRYIYAIGGNESAALAAGINVDAVKLKAYVLAGSLVGLAGTLSVSRLKSAPPAFGNAYELDAIAGCIIGGVSFNGGIGKVWSSVVGAFILVIIQQGMDMLDVQTFYQQIVKGLIIILAVLGDRKRII
ncbi:MAG: ABC transporter permease [Eubacteriales bacterium]|nr:ABC transporter permease [Eubacteriales bacterium]